MLLVQSDIRGGLPSSPDESQGGDAAVAFLIGDANADQLLASYLGGSSETLEFIDRWRNPSEKVTKQWESRFVEDAYLPLIRKAGLRPWQTAASKKAMWIRHFLGSK